MKEQANKAVSKYKYARISPLKVMPVLNMVRGKSVAYAEHFLTFDPTKASKMVLKTLKSAMANAGQKGLTNEQLVIKKAVVDAAPTAKRGRPGSRSRYKKILKRSAHIVVEIGAKEDK
ncbi:50S ribosomal protein L22 [Patescibacteria group bacterium]|nr:50S ribosomal protein L22 [Patescibacteria group bacterium]